MLSLFLHRISVVRVYLYIAATTLDPVGQDPRHLGGRRILETKEPAGKFLPL